MGACRTCGDVEPLFADGLCEDCHYEDQRERADLDDTNIGWADDDDTWGEEP